MRLKYFLLFFILIFVVSCNSSFLNNQKHPQPFSFKKAFPHSLNSEYSLRMDKYDKIIRTAPIPVFIINRTELPIKFIEALNADIILYGLYVNNNSFDYSWPKNFIFINKNNSPEQIMTTYFHEYQHYRCAKNNCYCMSFKKSDQVIAAIFREKHAIMNELESGLKLEDSNLLINSIDSIIGYILRGNIHTYKIASVSIFDEKIWEKVKKFAKEKQKGNILKFR